MQILHHGQIAVTTESYNEVSTAKTTNPLKLAGKGCRGPGPWRDPSLTATQPIQILLESARRSIRSHGIFTPRGPQPTRSRPNRIIGARSLRVQPGYQPRRVGREDGISASGPA